MLCLSLLSAGVAVANGSTNSSKHWAVIIAGSNTYDNYRHQADACHAYHVVRNNGIPEEQIITMMFDDVAHAKENPFPGKLFNRWTKKGELGYDVYEGCNIDYRGKTVTPAHFAQVLTGDKKGKLAAECKETPKLCNGKVLNSGPADHVFVNFVDHGASGVIGFPEDSPGTAQMTASYLQRTIKAMHTSNMYAKLVFYLESCNSGSMFEGLEEGLDVYTTTAANPTEPSYGVFCPPYDRVDGKELNTCLGDMYSVNWMNDTDMQGVGHPLQAQFESVRNKTKKKSHVMQYGDTAIAAEDVGEYQAKAATTAATAAAATAVADAEAEEAAMGASAVDSRDVPLVLAFYRYLRASSGTRTSLSDGGGAGKADLARALVAHVESRERADALMHGLLQKLAGLKPGAGSAGDSDSASVGAGFAQCRDDALAGVQAACPQLDSSWTGYHGRYSAAVAEYCREGEGRPRPLSVADIERAATSVCGTSAE